MRILIGNDDGINSTGIKVLASVFSQDNDVIVVAPDAERSAFSHSLTIFRDLSCKRVDFIGGIEAYSTSGTPADCIKFALLHLFKDNPPDIVISGINNGPNLGSDTMYSGTVAGAMEAAYLGYPAIALSLNYWNKGEECYREAAEFLRHNLSALLSVKGGIDTILNINYPVTAPYVGVKFAKSGVNLYSDLFTAGETEGSYRLKGKPIDNNINDEDCDVEWSKKGFATVTPLKLDRTDYGVLQMMKNGADIK